MDFTLLLILKPSLDAGISQVLVSYNISCQWHKNLQAHLDSYSAFPGLDLSSFEYWRVVVPKFHLSGHRTECQVVFNLAYTKWAGQTDGKCIESGWAQSTSMATWTQESGPNTHRNILDNHWNASSWQKLLGLCKYYPFLIPPSFNVLCSLGKFFEKSLQRSLAWSKSQREVATLMSKSYKNPIVDKWHKMRKEFDLDPSKPNPYKETDHCACFFKRIFLPSLTSFQTSPWLS